MSKEKSGCFPGFKMATSIVEDNFLKFWLFLVSSHPSNAVSFIGSYLLFTGGNEH